MNYLPPTFSHHMITPTYENNFVTKLSKTLFYRFWIANSTVTLNHRAVRADSQFINNKQLIMSSSVFQLSGWIV